MKDTDKKKERNRIKKYARFLKNNHDWDYVFILDMLWFKLKMVKEYIRDEGHMIEESQNKKVSEIEEVEKLLKTVVDDNYAEELNADFEKNYGKIEHKFIKVDSTTGSRKLEIVWHVPDEKLVEAKKVYQQNIKLAADLQKADLKRAFDLMVENIWGWWD